MQQSLTFDLQNDFFHTVDILKKNVVDNINLEWIDDKISIPKNESKNDTILTIINLLNYNNAILSKSNVACILELIQTLAKHKQREILPAIFAKQSNNAYKYSEFVNAVNMYIEEELQDAITTETLLYKLYHRNNYFMIIVLSEHLPTSVLRHRALQVLYVKVLTTKFAKLTIGEADSIILTINNKLSPQEIEEHFPADAASRLLEYGNAEARVIPSFYQLAHIRSYIEQHHLMQMPKEVISIVMQYFSKPCYEVFVRDLQDTQTFFCKTANPLDLCILGNGCVVTTNLRTFVYNPLSYLTTSQGPAGQTIFHPCAAVPGNFSHVVQKIAPQHATTKIIANVKLDAYATLPIVMFSNNCPPDPTSYNACFTTNVFNGFGQKFELAMYFLKQPLPGVWQARFLLNGIDIANNQAINFAQAAANSAVDNRVANKSSYTLVFNAEGKFVPCSLESPSEFVRNQEVVSQHNPTELQEANTLPVLDAGDLVINRVGIMLKFRTNLSGARTEFDEFSISDKDASAYTIKHSINSMFALHGVVAKTINTTVILTNGTYNGEPLLAGNFVINNVEITGTPATADCAGLVYLINNINGSGIPGVIADVVDNNNLRLVADDGRNITLQSNGYANISFSNFPANGRHNLHKVKSGQISLTSKIENGPIVISGNHPEIAGFTAGHHAGIVHNASELIDLELMFPAGGAIQTNTDPAVTSNNYPSKVTIDFSNSLETYNGEMSAQFSQDSCMASYVLLEEPRMPAIFYKNNSFAIDDAGFIVDGQGNLLLGFASDPDGSISEALLPLQIPIHGIAAQATSLVTIARNLDPTIVREQGFVFGFTRDNPPDPDTYVFSATIPIFYRDQVQHILETYFVQGLNRCWQVFIGIDGNDVTPQASPLPEGATHNNPISFAREQTAMPFTLVFSDDGKLVPHVPESPPQYYGNATITSMVDTTILFDVGTLRVPELGDLVINRTQISTDIHDNSSTTDHAVSAINICININSSSSKHKTVATVNPTILDFVSGIYTTDQLNADEFSINGINIIGIPASETCDALVDLINNINGAGVPGVMATNNNGDLRLIAQDGRNIEIYTNGLATALHFSNFTVSGGAALHKVIRGSLSIRGQDSRTPIIISGNAPERVGLIAGIYAGVVNSYSDNVSITVDSINIRFDFSGSTAFADNQEVTTIQQNGYPAGKFLAVELTDDGDVITHFTNDVKKLIGRVAVADFANAQELTELKNGSYATNAASGPAIIGASSTTVAMPQRQTTLGVIKAGVIRYRPDLSFSDVCGTREQLPKALIFSSKFGAPRRITSTASTSNSLMQHTTDVVLKPGR